MSFSTIIVIYNPNSTGSSKDMAREFKENLQARLPRQKIELIATTHAGHAFDLAYEAAKASKNPLIISSSGDGGYNEVINGAMRAQREGHVVTTGLLPAGNANDHYHSLHDEDIIELIARNETKKIDLLKITSTSEGKPIERYAHSYIGLGVTSKIGKELNKTKLNAFNEIWLVARALFVIKPIRLKLGRKPKRYESVIFSNVDKMSKYMTISDPSSMTDGQFEVTVFKPRNKLQLILILLKASLAGVKHNVRVKTYEFETVHKTSVQADGEIIMLDPGVKVAIGIERQVLPSII